jgi:hypothetical protein
MRSAGTDRAPGDGGPLLPGFGFLANPHSKKLRKPPVPTHHPAANKGTSGTRPSTQRPPGAGAGLRAGGARARIEERRS